MSLKKKDRVYIENCVENEGFDYAFAHYTTFDDIKDVEFHRLRTAYLAARLALIDYAGIEE